MLNSLLCSLTQANVLTSCALLNEGTLPSLHLVSLIFSTAIPTVLAHRHLCILPSLHLVSVVFGAAIPTSHKKGYKKVYKNVQNVQKSL